MTRRALWLIPLALCLAADPAGEVLDLFTDLAASLAAGNAVDFLSKFDRKMPGYEKLSENVTALTRQSDIESFVDLTRNEGDGQNREVEANWKMRIKTGADATASPGRQQLLKCRVEKQGKKWRITALEPVDFFAP
ncbi:MAG TPA: hypothetical protein VMH28_24145 [Candidatus Acidoferrales bacterium]|nr:hypothetical protein [Candidatus Acidoferrales bacterium]